LRARLAPLGCDEHEGRVPATCTKRDCCGPAKATNMAMSLETQVVKDSLQTSMMDACPYDIDEAVNSCWHAACNLQAEATKGAPGEAVLHTWPCPARLLAGASAPAT
jgi:hypothetical protein